MLVVVLQEWLCSCADIVPAAVASPNNTAIVNNAHPSHAQDPLDVQMAAQSSNDDYHLQQQQRQHQITTSSEHHPTTSTSLSTSPATAAAATQVVERLTPSALVAVHRVVLGLHTWALATDGGQPRNNNHNSNNTNTKITDEYHNSHPHHRPTPHKHQHNEHEFKLGNSSANVDSENNAEKQQQQHALSPYPRRPTSLDITQTTVSLKKNHTNTLLNNNQCAGEHNVNDNDNSNSGPQPASVPVVSIVPRNKKRRGPNGQLVGIVEECEYDSDAGKFTCAIIQDSSSSDASSSVVTTVSSNADDEEDFDDEDEDVTLSVSDFGSSTVAGGASSSSGSGNDNSNASTLQNVDMRPVLPGDVRRSGWDKGRTTEMTRDERNRSTMLCLGTFLLTCVLLYLLPAGD